MSEVTGISRTSIQRILKHYKWHPYKIQLLHELNEDDHDRRLQFCEIIGEKFNHAYQSLLYEADVPSEKLLICILRSCDIMDENVLTNAVLKLIRYKFTSGLKAPSFLETQLSLLIAGRLVITFQQLRRGSLLLFLVVPEEKNNSWLLGYAGQGSFVQNLLNAFE
nr:unnamed protein product [Callosobruchus chinensis]